MPSPAGSPTRRPRPSYLAVPPLLAESEPFEGAAVLREHPGALGALLWKSLRDLSLWIAAPPAERGVLFSPCAARTRQQEIADAVTEPELWGPLLVMAEALAVPTAVDHARLVNACRSVARWAERRGHGAVQLAFTQTAARLLPESPRLAYAVGRLARDRGEYARAESWLRAAVRLARRTDWHTYVLAYLSLGTLYQHVGNLPAARTLTLRGYRTSVRRRVHALHGTALHNLFVIAAEMHEFRRAQEFARAALDQYGSANPRLPALASDVAAFWIMNGRFANAATVLRALLPRCPDPAVRLMAVANLARASGALGDSTTFRAMWDEAAAAFTTPLSAERIAEAWINLARGAASLGDRDRAVHAVDAALAIASDLRLAQIQMEAEVVMAAVRSDAAVAGAPPAPVRSDPRAEEFARALEHLLETEVLAAGSSG